MNTALLSFFLITATAPLAQESLAIEHVTVVVPESNRLLSERTVIIQGDRILSVSASDAAPLPAALRRIDGRGKFLLPGLADMHVHLTDPRDGLLYVASGVTTIRNLSGQPFHLDLNEAYERGHWIGPTLKSSGPQVRLPGNATPEQARAVIREHQRMGYASVKLYGETSRANYAAMAEASRELGMPIVGHVPRNLRLEDIVEVAGHREISHTEELLYSFMQKHSGPTEELLEECAGLLAEAGVYVTPTISVYAEIPPQVTDLDGVLARSDMRLLPPLARIMFGPDLNKYRGFDQGDLAAVERGTKTILALTGMLAKQGVPLLLGTDAMNPAVIPGVSIVDELERLVQAGLSPAQALSAGTSTPAEFCNESQEFGRIAAGLRADLMLLNANPLLDVRHVRRPEAVVLRGKWFSRAELDQQLELQVKGYGLESAPLRSLDKANPRDCMTEIQKLKEAPPEALFLSLVSVYAMLGNLEAVHLIAEQGISSYPESELLVNRLAEAQTQAGDLQAARATYDYTLELNPANTIAQRAIASLENR